ncbi:MAG: acetolactate synthase, large subunit, biosynthetic type [Deltaproteobacteria bacterium HGW-Deltaproteobacteria-19]|nr:MAG: acetolactate synthase, large subunit, biosynthetic type [Deltaproteobacteria bacterium HGW-Deltaproteobacteria-19]
MKLTGSQVLLRTMRREDVDVIFGYPGGVVLPIYDELYKEKFRHLLVRHEQGAIHAADGYARVSGKVGVCLVTSGPGATNTVTGIANAYMDSIPVVIFTGQVPTGLIGSDAFQEVDITGITRPCTKHNFLVRRIEDLASTIHEAFHIARSGRPGPVLVDLPRDVSQATIEEEDIRDDFNTLNGLEKPQQEDIAKAVEMIRAARKPVIVSGGGVLLGKASEELREFVRRTGFPITSTLMGLGAYPGSDPLWLGMPGMHGTYYANMAITGCDLLVAVGMRFDDRVTSKVDTFAPNAKIIHIDIDPVSIDRIVRSHLSIVSDAKTALGMLNAALAGGDPVPAEQTREWMDQIDAWKKRVPLRFSESTDRIKPQQVIRKLYELTKGEALIATEVGQNQMWAAQYYTYDHPHTFISSGGLGTMGFGFPAAVGAQVARPEKTVIDIAGDGSIQMNIQELATAVQYNIPVKIVILNNQYLGMVRQWQQMFYGRRYSHTDMSYAPDFVKIAEAYGATGLRASRPEELEAVLKKGLETPGVVVMDIRVEKEECVYPMVRPGASIADMDLGLELPAAETAPTNGGEDPQTRSFN